MVMLLAAALTYVLVHGSHNIISGTNVSIESALVKRDVYGSDFLWFRSKGQGYLIRDQATLERIDRLFDPERALDPEAERIRTELRPLERRESELDREIDALTDRDEGPELSAAEEQKLDRLRQEMGGLHSKMRVLERQEEEVDRKRDALEAQAEQQMVPILEDAVRSGVARPVR
jgi:prefoldin subunit 5